MELTSKNVTCLARNGNSLRHLRTSDFTRERGECIIGGLAAFRYFFTVFLWTPVSRVIPLMDRPLHLASWTASHLAICFGVGFLGEWSAFLQTLAEPSS